MDHSLWLIINGLKSIDHSLNIFYLNCHKSVFKGKFPLTISCRFTGELEGQKRGEWLDKTFLGNYHNL